MSDRQALSGTAARGGANPQWRTASTACAGRDPGGPPPGIPSVASPIAPPVLNGNHWPRRTAYILSHTRQMEATPHPGQHRHNLPLAMTPSIRALPAAPPEPSMASNHSPLSMATRITTHGPHIMCRSNHARGDRGRWTSSPEADQSCREYPPAGNPSIAQPNQYQARHTHSA